LRVPGPSLLIGSMTLMHAPTEGVVVEQVKARVHERLPGVSLQSIEAEVTGLFHEYAGSKVRAYLPILVERDAIDHLRRSASDSVT
jgi:hypothetical protein